MLSTKPAPTGSANHVGLAMSRACPLIPQERRQADIAGGRIRAKTGRERVQQDRPLFDHLVGERQQPIRHIDPERLRGLEVDHQLELGRLFYWQRGYIRAWFCDRDR
jgi:hypothetical protein